MKHAEFFDSSISVYIHKKLTIILMLNFATEAKLSFQYACPISCVHLQTFQKLNFLMLQYLNYEELPSELHLLTFIIHEKGHSGARNNYSLIPQQRWHFKNYHTNINFLE